MNDIVKVSSLEELRLALETFEELENERNNQIEHVKELMSDEWIRKAKRAFARMGVFNPYSLQDWDRIARSMFYGKIPLVPKDFWFMDQTGNNPLRLNRLRSSRRKYSDNRWNLVIEGSPLLITPHAFGRFRERTGTWVNPDLQCWDIPHIPTCASLDESGNPVRNALLPTIGGAWLGYGAISLGEHREKYEYRRSVGLCETSDRNAVTYQFYAMTYITEDMMRDEQIDICRAYEAGDYERCLELTARQKQ